MSYDPDKSWNRQEGLGTREELRNVVTEELQKQKESL
jgi:hypothetical protein